MLHIFAFTFLAVKYKVFFVDVRYYSTDIGRYCSSVSVTDLLFRKFNLLNSD